MALGVGDVPPPVEGNLTQRKQAVAQWSEFQKREEAMGRKKFEPGEAAGRRLSRIVSGKGESPGAVARREESAQLREEVAMAKSEVLKQKVAEVAKDLAAKGLMSDEGLKYMTRDGEYGGGGEGELHKPSVLAVAYDAEHGAARYIEDYTVFVPMTGEYQRQPVMLPDNLKLVNPDFKYLVVNRQQGAVARYELVTDPDEYGYARDTFAREKEGKMLEGSPLGKADAMYFRFVSEKEWREGVPQDVKDNEGAVVNIRDIRAKIEKVA